MYAKCRVPACAGAGAIHVIIAFGLLNVACFTAFPNAGVGELLQKLGARPHLLSIDHAPAVPTSRPPPVNCKEFGLGEEKLFQEGQLYHNTHITHSTNATCRSKHEQQCFRKNSPFIPPTFLSALRAYELYHERCTRNLNLTALGIAGEVPDGCKYLVWKAKDGMGNQLLSLVCAFIYSLLTHRAMLIGTDSHIHTYLCNPFPFSSWLLPPDFPESRLRTSAMRVDAYVSETLHHPISISPKHLHVSITCCDRGRDHLFFCPASQKLFSGINWIFYLSHEHTLPALYFIPEFRRSLNLWFPNHDAFMHASRYLLHPEDEIWEHISQFYKSHMDGVQKQIGVQVRVWKNTYDPPVSAQMSRCLIEQMLLPKPQQVSNQNNKASHASGVMDMDVQNAHPDILALVASLRSEYHDDLAFQYANHDGTNGSTYVSVVAASMERSQRTGNAAHDVAAIADIWLLSFMHDMVITPYSTFGSVASGMAGIVPLVFINYGQDKVREAACKRSNVAGPCFLVYPKRLVCALDPPSFSIMAPASMVPEVKFCEYNSGIGVESTFFIP